MEIVNMILSGLALLAAILCLILIIQEKKRNQKRNAASLQYVDAAVQKALVLAKNEAHAASEAVYKNLCERFENRVSDLEKGVVPEFEEAKAAADAVNDFNRGLSAIMGFDPLEAARNIRKSRTIGGEVE